LKYSTLVLVITVLTLIPYTTLFRSCTADSKFSLLHLPDYDPSGLSEFQRLHARLGKRVALYLPSDMEARFARFSNPELVTRANRDRKSTRLNSSHEWI